MSDGLLILGFGGPEPGCCGRRPDCPRSPGCEAACFIAGILGDDPAKAPRVAAVAARYAEVGGASPYNRHAREQVAALEAELRRRGRREPLALGYRHWSPWPIDAARALHAAGCRRVSALVLAPQRSGASWKAYLDAGRAACAAAGLELAGANPDWHRDPGFIAANAARLRSVGLPGPDEVLLVVAHALPERAEGAAAYRAAVEAGADLLADALGLAGARLAWCSAPPAPGWLRPGVDEALAGLAGEGVRGVVVCALGFLVDHMEVIWDLDREAAATARRLGLAWRRAPCVHSHPDFIACLADQAEAALDRPEAG